MAHKQCIKGLRLTHNCDCIKDDLIMLKLIENNLVNLEKIINKYFEEYKHNPSISTFVHYLQIRLKELK